jgi:predicted metal-dependent hydrolase
MRRRWGSCSPKGRITLNAELMKVPPPCVDYVLTHELCHLLVADHSPQFYRLLTTCMPEWERHRRQLNEIRT